MPLSLPPLGESRRPQAHRFRSSISSSVPERPLPYGRGSDGAFGHIFFFGAATVSNVRSLIPTVLIAPKHHESIAFHHLVKGRRHFAARAPIALSGRQLYGITC